MMNIRKVFLGLGWFVLVLVVLHFILASSLGLSVDEAHYLLYASHPALSYFDHPPLVGWLQIPQVQSNAPVWIIRLLPELIWVFNLFLVYKLAVRLVVADDENNNKYQVGRRAGVWAAIAFCLAPIQHVLAIGLLPDTLLILWTLLAAHITLNLLHTDAKKMQWVYLGLVLGLSGLSQYIAILPAVVVAAVLIVANPKKILSQWTAYLAIAIAAVMVVPVFIWNAQHDWISFTYQLNHGAKGTWGGVNEIRFLLVQLAVYGLLPLWGFNSLFDSKQGVSVKDSCFLAALAWLPFVFMAFFAGYGNSLPYWTAPFWAVACGLAGPYLAKSWQGRGKIGLQIIVVVQAATIILGFILVLTAGLPLTSGKTMGQGNTSHPSNPLSDVFGWDKAAKQAQSLALEYKIDDLAVQNWTLASRLAWYARPMRVHVVGKDVSQFTFWYGNLSQGDNTLLVDWSQLEHPVPVGSHGFQNCLEVGQHDVHRLGDVIAYFHFYACYNWQGPVVASDF